MRRSTPIIAVAFLLAVVLSLPAAGAQAEFCQRHPASPRCQVETPRPSGPAPTTTCAGYAEDRVWREAQAWWDADGLALPGQVGEHIHLGACWPDRSAIVRGTLHVDVRVTCHACDEATHHFLSRMRVNWRPVDSESGGGLLLDSTSGWDIALDANGHGQRWFGLDLNLSSLGSGTRRIRFNAMAGDDPDRFFVGTDWALNVITRTVTTPRTLGKVWYSGHGYQNPVLISAIPTAPVSGTWCVQVNMNPGGDGRPTVQHGDYVDPDFHAGSPGLIVRQAAGAFFGMSCLDTTRLANGPHRRVFVARDANEAGVLAIPFTVQNPDE